MGIIAALSSEPVEEDCLGVAAGASRVVVMLLGVTVGKFRYVKFPKLFLMRSGKLNLGTLLCGGFPASVERANNLDPVIQWLVFADSFTD